MKLKNKKIVSISLAGIITIIVIIILTIIVLGRNKNTQQDKEFSREDKISQNENSIQHIDDLNDKVASKTNLFYTVSEFNTDPKKITVHIFDSEKNILKSKIIEIDDKLSSSPNESFGTNYAAQFNPETNDIFISTQGASDYDGSCLNKDGTCASRIYKININQEKPFVIFETNNRFMNWIVNSADDSIIISFLENNRGNGYERILKKISGKNGKEIFTKKYQLHGETGQFVLSKDKKFIYQTTVSEGKTSNNIFKLEKIDNITGDISEQEILGRGGSIRCDTNLSPNNDYIAYYSTFRNRPPKLYVYQFSAKHLIEIPLQGTIGNYGLSWSGADEKLIYIPENKIVYYDIKKDKKNIFEQGSKDLNARVFENQGAPSNYVLYYSVELKKNINIYDISKNKKVDFNQDIFSILNSQSIIGLSWF